MRIPNFSVRNNRSVHLAVCDTCPKVMVITGPNGSGKSTLLDCLRQSGGAPGPILYVGPHRTSRRQTVRARYLYQQPIQMRKLLSEINLPGFEGINIPNRNRNAWDFDEASSYLKNGLCQIELDRQAAITNRLDLNGEITKGSLPDIWSPLKEMTENLLPHLRFSKIDVSNRDQVQCLWNVHSKDITVDIDDLSSGEKAVIQLFFPLIENRIQLLLERTKGSKTEDKKEHVCVLMDEPDLHLHPVLQGKVLDYIRSISIKDDVQFIIVTHSPIIVEHANSDELFLLMPSELVHGETNQLVRIANDDEKLDLMRDVFGSTSNITAMRPLLIVEGRKEGKDSRRPSDSRIYGFLSEKFNQVTIVPGGGKSECKTLAHSLTDILKELSPELKAYALLDRDIEKQEPEDDLLYYLPVSMIENLLINPKVIWDAIATVRHKTDFQSLEGIEKSLSILLDGMEQKEINRRIKYDIGAHTFRVRDPIDDIEKQVKEHIDKINNKTCSEALERVKNLAAKEIETIKTKNKRREYFHGKNILKQFYQRHLHSTGMSKEIFIYECARQASSRKLVIEFAKNLFEIIHHPSELRKNEN